MPNERLLRFGAACALLGGALRIASSFTPYVAESATHEAFYALIDVCLLFGVLGIYLRAADRLGMAGLAGFACALAGVGSIIGPDAQQFGIDFYQAGGAVFLLGLAGLAVQALRARVLMAAAGFWLLALALFLGAAVAGSPVAFVAGGVSLGLGFVSGGLAGLRPARAAAPA